MFSSCVRDLCRNDLYLESKNRSIFRIPLKGQCHEIFCFRLFAWITFHQAPENDIRVISNFVENSRRYSQVKVHRGKFAAGINDTSGKLPPVSTSSACVVGRRCRWYRWQIMGTISGCRHLTVNLKAKIYIYVKSTTQRCPNKIIKNFLLEDFLHLPPVSLTPVVHLEPRISPRIFEKI